MRTKDEINEMIVMLMQYDTFGSPLLLRTAQSLDDKLQILLWVLQEPDKTRKV